MPVSKRAFVASRLQRRLRRTGERDFETYLALIRSTSAPGRMERLEFVSALTTNVTSLYREPHHFALLADVLRNHRPAGRGGPCRIWSAGCATGEEPLSIAATCRAVLGIGWARMVEILATDVDEAVLTVARAQSTNVDIAAKIKSLPEDILPEGSFARQDPHRLLVALTAGITYRQHNLLAPPPGPHRFDVIFCRNVTIYFSRDAQLHVHRMLRERLVPGGLLAIGHSETLQGDAPPMAQAGRTAFRRLPQTDDKQTELARSWR